MSFKKILAPEEIDPDPLGCQKDNHTINFKTSYTILKRRGWPEGLTEDNRGEKSDLLAQCGTICHFKLEQVYKLILIQWWLWILKMHWNVTFLKKKRKSFKSSSIYVCAP